MSKKTDDAIAKITAECEGKEYLIPFEEYLSDIHLQRRSCRKNPERGQDAGRLLQEDEGSGQEQAEKRLCIYSARGRLWNHQRIL